MIFYQISFGAYCKERLDETIELIAEYLAALVQNGQIDKNYDIVPWQGQVVAYVNALGLKAEHRQFHSVWGKERLKDVRKFFGQTPNWTFNEDFPPKKLATWKDAAFLYLSTHLFDSESSLCLGNDGTPFPYFRLPLTDEEKRKIYYWTAKYREFDSIWIGSGELEMPAYRLLADPDSSLSTKGRECCAIIEKATGIPTYYYLMRHYGRKSADEKKRRCPGCGKPWFVEYPESDRPFWEFDFMCKRCRLVSNLAYDDDNSRYAKIGEPRKEKK